MASDMGGQASAFRHREVVRFINNEVLSNGGSPDFYLAFRSQPWHEVEDQLRAIVSNPQVTDAIKRAWTWSGLAVSVCVAARQREHQARQIRRLQRQLERLHQEFQARDEQLRSTQGALQQALNHRDALQRRLYQIEGWVRGPLLPVGTVPVVQVQPYMAAARPWHADYTSMMTVRAQSMVYMETQMVVPAPVLYTNPAPVLYTNPAPVLYTNPAPPYPWSPVFQQPPPMGMVIPCQYRTPFLVVTRFPPLPPVVVVATDAAATRFPMPPGRIYPPCPQAPMGFPMMAPLQHQRYYHQPGGFSIPQGPVPLRNIRSHSQAEGSVRPQAAARLGGSQSSGVREMANQQQPQGQKAMQQRGSDQQQEMPASRGSTGNWECPGCKAMNFSWRVTCYKCKKVHTSVESGGPDPGQAPH